MNRKFEPGNNVHERLIEAYCRNSFSAAGLFHPTPRKKTGEPADLALKAGRTVFLFWMQESKQWFHSSCEHNLNKRQNIFLDGKKGYQFGAETSSEILKSTGPTLITSP